ncbi:extracellular solute-binding protein [Paenibacillus sp. GCM10027626]|uniref:extracellular solute-binding protein n=1 Tax=Paenibacillus sp. GCM10027626 TaxID=3273411 RepID=UPI00362D7DC3
MKKRGYLSLALALSLSGTTWLAGCSGGEGGGTTPSAEGGNQGGGNGGGEERQKEGNLYLTGLPVVEKQYKFKVFAPALLIDPNDVKIFQELNEKANVKVEWDIPAWEQQAEKRNLMFASGDYADVVAGWGLSAADVMNRGPKGIYIPLEELIDKYTVNIKQMLEERPDVRKALTTPDGHIYTLPIVDTQPSTTAVMHINKKWLDQLGLPKPTTTDELYEVLKAFKEKDPNQNNKQDELPLSFMFNGSGNNDQFGMFGWFGRIDSHKHLVIEGKKVLYTAQHQEWKDALKYFNKLWSEGLIDPEVFTHDVQQYEAKGRLEPELYGVMSSWDGYTAVGDEHMKDYEILPPLQADNGTKPVWPGGDPGIFTSMFAITSAAEQPEAILRWLDEFFITGTAESLSPYFYGPENEGWARNEQGKFVLTPVEGSLDKWGVISGFPSYLKKEARDNLYLKPGTREHYKKGAIAEAYAPYVSQEQEPLSYLWLTPEQQTEISVIETDLLKYTNDTMAKWITGGADIDAEWDKFQQKLLDMGVEKVLGVYQTALDSYNNG